MRADYAVVRHEKPVWDDSVSATRYEVMTFDQEASSHSKGAEKVKKQTVVDPNRIFFLGHLLGGVTAPVLA